MSYPLSDVMDRVAALMTDVAKTDYTYAAQLPYVAIALDELQEVFEQNNIPTTNEESSALTITAGVKTIDFSTTPALPSNLVEIQQLWEKPAGSTAGYTPMTKMNFLPHYLEDQLSSSLTYWAWEQQVVKFLGATIDVDIKFDFIASMFPTSITSTTQITQLNTKTFLAYRTAALCAEFIGHNPTTAGSLNQNCIVAMDRALGIPVKGQQAIAIRRRPFRAAYRARTVG